MIKYLENLSYLTKYLQKKEYIWSVVIWMLLIIMAYLYSGYHLENNIHRYLSATYNEVIQSFAHVSDKTFNYNKNTLTDQDRLEYDKTIHSISTEMKKNFGNQFNSVYIVDAFNVTLAHNDTSLILKTIKTNDLNEKNIKDYLLNVESETLDNISLFEKYERNKRILVFCYEINMMDEPVAKCCIVLSAESIDEYIVAVTKKTHMILALIIILFTIIVIISVKNFKKSGLSSSIVVKESATYPGTQIFNKNNRVGSYIIKKEIQKGDNSVVYEGIHENKIIKSRVAIKTVNPEKSDHDYIGHFLRESEILSLLNHKNIVRIIDFKEDPLALIMEFVNGERLSQVIKATRKGLRLDQFVFIVTEICEGLSYAHGIHDEDNIPLNIIHRDINPNNILISYEGNVKITDFGISKVLKFRSYTRMGVIKGTDNYMSPEQVMGQKKDIKQQSDIYSLGIVLYEMLSGKRLNKFDTIQEACTKIPTQIPPPIKAVRKDIPDELNDIVMKCIEKKIENRYQDVKSILDDLNIIKIKYQLFYSASDLSQFMKQHFKKKLKKRKN